MSGVLLKPRFRVSKYFAVTGAHLVAVEMDDFQTTLLLSRTQARRLAKSLTREADLESPHVRSATPSRV